MKQTTKYKLNLIEASDPFGPEALNQNTQAVEDKLAALDAASAAHDAAIQTAQATANAARTTANAAYSPNQKPYVTGSYVGTGADLSINIGFRPSFLIIDGTPSLAVQTNLQLLCGYFVATAGKIMSQCVTFTNTGFTVHVVTGYPDLTHKSLTFDYIAFR